MSFNIENILVQTKTLLNKKEKNSSEFTKKGTFFTLDYLGQVHIARICIDYFTKYILMSCEHLQKQTDIMPMPTPYVGRETK